jgi:hypothetical protein
MALITGSDVSPTQDLDPPTKKARPGCGVGYGCGVINSLALVGMGQACGSIAYSGVVGTPSIMDSSRNVLIITRRIFVQCLRRGCTISTIGATVQDCGEFRPTDHYAVQGSTESAVAQAPVPTQRH